MSFLLAKSFNNRVSFARSDPANRQQKSPDEPGFFVERL
jgi:hypothetical protein